MSTPTKKNTRRKVVKAWAIVRNRGGLLNWFCDPKSGKAIIHSRKEANTALAEQFMTLPDKGLSIVPCTISYSLPATLRRPK